MSTRREGTMNSLPANGDHDDLDFDALLEASSLGAPRVVATLGTTEPEARRKFEQAAKTPRTAPAEPTPADPLEAADETPTARPEPDESTTARTMSAAHPCLLHLSTGSGKTRQYLSAPRAALLLTIREELRRELTLTAIDGQHLVAPTGMGRSRLLDALAMWLARRAGGVRLREHDRALLPQIHAAIAGQVASTLTPPSAGHLTDAAVHGASRAPSAHHDQSACTLARWVQGPGNRQERPPASVLLPAAWAAPDFAQLTAPWQIACEPALPQPASASTPSHRSGANQVLRTWALGWSIRSYERDVLAARNISMHNRPGITGNLGVPLTSALLADLEPGAYHWTPWALCLADSEHVRSTAAPSWPVRRWLAAREEHAMVPLPLHEEHGCALLEQLLGEFDLAPTTRQVSTTTPFLHLLCPAGSQESTKPAPVPRTGDTKLPPTKRRAVHTEIEGRFHADDVSLPILVRFHYRPADPIAVEVVFDVGEDHEVPWILSRELLVQGMHTRTGIGDVVVWTDRHDNPAQSRTFIGLTTSTAALVSVPHTQIQRFLDDALNSVPRHEEHQCFATLLDELEEQLLRPAALPGPSDG
ncbi:SsgA family sporulation/cell division regulator [Streptomyces sp. NPDC054835]